MSVSAGSCAWPSTPAPANHGGRQAVQAPRLIPVVGSWSLHEQAQEAGVAAGCGTLSLRALCRRLTASLMVLLPPSPSHALLALGVREKACLRGFLLSLPRSTFSRDPRVKTSFTSYAVSHVSRRGEGACVSLSEVYQVWRWGGSTVPRAQTGGGGGCAGPPWQCHGAEIAPHACRLLPRHGLPSTATQAVSA